MRRVLLLFTLLVSFTLCARAEDKVLPESVSLTGPHDYQRILVVRTDRGGRIRGKIESYDTQSGDRQVAVVQNGRVVPVGNGKTSITVTTKSGKVTLPVTVRGLETPARPSFRHDVLPIFAKLGCNSGACHGALAGKGGLKLSLRGYDPQADFHVVARQSRGRRIETADPGRSLILTKPSGAVPHKGGLRFEPKSEHYNTIAQWIAQGAAGPADEETRLERIDVLPKATVLKPGETHRFLVQATYSDGRIRDVTSLARFTSANEAVATIDDSGQATVVGHGEGAVSVWYDSRIVMARVTVPYNNKTSPNLYTAARRRNVIDAMVLEKLAELNLVPSGPATDSEFIRRAFLDTIGTLPTPDEVRAFLDDSADDKRDRLIDALLERPEFVDYWTYQWSDILLINGTRLRPKSVEAYYKWVRNHVSRNTPWDKFVSDLLTAQGSSHESGATNFFALHQTPEDMAENASQAFLGLSIGCAKCHNHPLEKWTNDQYYAFANLFSRVRAKGWGGDGRNGSGLRTLYVVDEGELLQPGRGTAQPPTPLDGKPVPFDDVTDRREHLAQWLTSPNNKYFSKSITNRVWKNFFGTALVESVDDMRVSNPASNEALLTAAADYLVEHDFDLKSLMRLILRSATYQQSSRPVPGNREEKRFYARYYPRRLMAEVMLDAMSQVTGVATPFTQIEFPGADKQKTGFYKPGTRAIQLYDSAVASYFLKTFGRNQRRITCECERSDEPSMVQVLHISNGDTLNQKLAGKQNRLTKLLASGKTTNEILDEAFLAALARFPTEKERVELGRLLDDAPTDEKRSALEDLFWSLMSSREFLFNH